MLVSYAKAPARGSSDGVYWQVRQTCRLCYSNSFKTENSSIAASKESYREGERLLIAGSSQTKATKAVGGLCRRYVIRDIRASSRPRSGASGRVINFIMCGFAVLWGALKSRHMAE